MKKILLATDFSPCAENAMRYAMAIATRLPAQITVIHFVHPTQAVNNNIWDAYFMEDILDAKKKALDEWTSKFRYPELMIDSVCQINYLESGLNQFIEDNPVDLLIMGSTGSTSVLGILGSNAASVVANTLVPTLIIPPDAVYKDNPLVVLASDFKPLTEDNAHVLSELIGTMKAASLNVLHVCEDDDKAGHQVQEAVLEHALPDVPLAFNYIKDKNVDGAITDFMVNNDIDLLCSVSHQHSFIHRLFRKDKIKTWANRAIKPILVLHEVSSRNAVAVLFLCFTTQK